MNRNFHLTEDEKNFLADRFETPFMVISLNKVQENYLYLKKYMV